MVHGLDGSLRIFTDRSVKIRSNTSNPCTDNIGENMQTLWQDLRYYARMSVKNPGFTLIATLTLALGVGANTAVYGVAQGVIAHVKESSENSSQQNAPALSALEVGKLVER